MTRAELLAACAGPIDFTAAMARACHEGRKTRTMRVMKDLPEGTHCIEQDEVGRWIAWWERHRNDNGRACLSAGGTWIKPRHSVGDILYVREPWRNGDCCDNLLFDCGRGVADCEIFLSRYMYQGDDFPCRDACEWSPPETMPPEAVRTFLRVTGVKAQRAMDITIDEYWAAGMEVTCDCDEYGPPYCVGDDWTLAQADEDDSCSLRDAWRKVFILSTHPSTGAKIPGAGCMSWKSWRWA